MRKSNRVRVHYERKSAGVRVGHEKKRDGVKTSPCEKEQWGES